MPFLGLFLAGFAYVGGASLWQGDIGQAVRGAFGRLRRPVPASAGSPSTFGTLPEVGPAAAAVQLDDEWNGGPTVKLIPGDRRASERVPA
jgi:hypothetical protein